jgi:hypothetical protein
MLKSETILLDLESARNQIRENYFNNKKWMSEATDDERRKQLRRIDNVREEIKQETIRFEAVSRMYLLNQNVAMEDMNARKLAEDAAVVLRDINLDPFIDNPNPSTEQARDVVRDIYQELEIPLDSKEYAMTEPAIVKEIVRGGAHLTDMALKFAVIDKLAAAGGLPVFFKGLAGTGRTGKAASGFLQMMFEEKKFQLIGGNEGTGAAFYMANKAFPSIKTGNKALDVIYNGFIKGSVGMTASMETVAGLESAYDGLVHDKDMIRTIKENFGEVDEAGRRILVELITAAPFGIKAMAERGAMFKANAKTVSKLADQMEADGQYEASAELKSQAAKLGDAKEYQEMNDYMFKVDVLKENNKYDRKMTLGEVDKTYEELMAEEGQVDMLKNKKVAVNTTDYFNPKVEFDALEYSGKIDALQKSGVDVKKKTVKQIDEEYAKLVEESNAYMNELREEVNVKESNTDELAEPKKPQSYKPRKSELAIKEAHREIKNTKKDTNWKKNLEPSAKKVAATVSEVKKRVGEEEFYESIEKFAGENKEGERITAQEFDYMVQNLFESKTKKQALETTELINDIIHKVEITSRPEADRLEYVTRKPSEGASTVTSLRDFRNNIASYKRGIKDGRADYHENMQEIYDMVNARSTLKVARQIATAGQLKKLARPLPKNATPKQVLNRLEQIDGMFRKLETQAFKNDIQQSIKKSRPSLVSGRVQQQKIDYVGGSKLNTIDIIFNNRSDKAAHAITQLNTVKESGIIEKGSYHDSLINAQMEALKHVKNREMAMNRQSELEEISSFRKLNMQEKIEYELLELVDGNRMTHADALRAREIAREIERTGRSVKERQEQFESIKHKLEVERGLQELNITEKELRDIEKRNVAPNAKESVGAIRKIRDAFKKGALAHESFITMMERLSVDAPNRKAWEGFLHTYSEDFYRAREGGISEYNRELNEVRTKLEDIHLLTGRQLDRQLKRDRKKNKTLKYHNSGKVVLRENTSVDQAVRWWQMLHNPGTWAVWGKMGWGIKPENIEGKFEAKEAKELMDTLKEFIVENSGSEAPLRAAEYQMEKYSQYYAEANNQYIKKHGVDLGYTENYVPVIFERNIKFNREGKEVGTETYSDIIEGGSEYHIKSVSPSFTKATQKSKNIKYDLQRGAEEVFSDYLRSLKHYKHFQDPIDRARKLFNDPFMQKALEYKFGSDFATKVIKKNIDDIALDVAAGDKLPWLTEVKNRFVTANLGANLILFPKQMMSVSAYRTGLEGHGENAMFTGFLMSGMVDGWKTIGELNRSQFMKNRAAGQSYNRDLIAAQKQAQELYKSGKMKPGSLRDWMLIMTKLGDRGAILVGGQAFYRTKFETYKKQGLSRPQAKQKAYDDFVKFTKLTQQSGFMEDLGHIQRFGTIGKYATLFQNTPQQYLRVEMAAWRNSVSAVKESRKHGIGSPERKAAIAKLNRSMRNAMIYHFLLPMTFRAASQGFYLGKDDKGSDRFIDDPGQLVAALLGSYSYAFLIGDLAKNLASLTAAGHAFDTEVGGVLQDVVTGTQESLKAILEASEYEDFKTEFNRILDGTSPITWQEIMTVAGTMSEFTGFPGTSLLNISKGVSDFASGRTDDPRALVGYGSGVLGKYNRSPQFDAMKPYLEQGIEKGLEGFLKHMMATTDFDYYTRNEARWIREFRMYERFGAYNPDVNFLYMGSRSNRERAKFLIGLRDGKDLLKPITLADAGRIFNEPMSPGVFQDYVNELIAYGVIDVNVIKEMKKIDLDIGRKATEAMRKAAQ